ncbi:DoxX family membrane protein [Dyella humicola]|uniref:DoxX family membrane protein n=1 Tax=Dyella humicola TaxID=2992126 RepID=UPI00225087EF|nr:DoxX family membrane protein [Dyella humicola]
MERSARPGHTRFGSPVLSTDDRRKSSAASPGLARVFFALTMIGLGVLGLIYGDVALVWQRIPIEHLPGRQLLAYACAVIELITGMGLLFRGTARITAAVLAVYLLFWLLLKVPAVVVMPQLEATWLGFGEIAVIFAGGWTLHASLADSGRRKGLGCITGKTGIRCARVVFALSLPMIGLSHFFYSEQTVAFVPAWLPFRLAWVYLTGAGSIAASMAILLGVVPRLAATLEATMLSIITLLVWGPGVIATPTDRTQWTALTISFAIAGGAWLVASSYRATARFGVGAYITNPSTG